MPLDLLPDLKRSRVESSDAFSDKMYSVYVKSAMEAMEKVCFLESATHLNDFRELQHLHPSALIMFLPWLIQMACWLFIQRFCSFPLHPTTQSLY